jgi:hypothetical protein
MVVGYVEVADYMPMISEIEKRVGRSEAIRRVGVAKNTWYSWLDKSRLRALRATMLRVERVFKEIKSSGETRTARSIKRGAQARGEEPRPEVVNGNRAEVVPCWQLSNVLRAWYDTWRRERPNYASGYNLPGEQQFYSPLTWLSEVTGIPPRTITAYIRNERKYVILENADAILQAIDKTDLLQTEITVMRNPQWSLEKYIEYMAERGCV